MENSTFPQKDNTYPQKKVHYAMIRNNENEIVAKLDRALGFYRIYFERKVKGLEIIYDTPNHLLSNAGIVLSKQYENGSYSFKVRKLSYLPSELRKPGGKFYLSQCKKNEAPKDYPMQIANAINNAFSNIFTIDLVEVVKQTIPIYEIKVNGNLYVLTSGIGMKGKIVFEKNTYRDLVNGRKVKCLGATVTLPGEPNFERERREVLDAIEHKCKELLLYDESRFEIAQRLLKPRVVKQNSEKIPKNKKMAFKKEENENQG